MGSADFAVIDKNLIPEFADNLCDGLFGNGMSLVMSEKKSTQRRISLRV